MKNFMTRSSSALLGAVSLRLLFDHLGHRHYRIPLVQVDQPDALGVSAVDADTAHRHPYDHPELRHHHDLIVFRHFAYADDVAAPLGRADVDDPHAAPSLEPVLAHGGALTQATLRHRQNVTAA